MTHAGEPPCLSTADAGLRREIDACWPGMAVERVAQIDSTNSELMRRVHGGVQQPVLLVARVQTAGRGRRGRQWLSTDAGEGAALTFSVGVPLAVQDWSGLSLAVGLAVAQGLDPRVQLKWPNDLWWQDRKLGGILVETASLGAMRYAVIGVGVNIRPRPAQGLSTPPAWVQELIPQADADHVLRCIVPSLLQTLRRFEQGGFAPFRSAFLARDALAGREILLSDGGSGRAGGVDEAGALLVHTAQGLQSVHGAEVSVRPLK